MQQAWPAHGLGLSGREQRPAPLGQVYAEIGLRPALAGGGGGLGHCPGG
jgi:hypothetical protein